jgi:hypothetical protein
VPWVRIDEEFPQHPKVVQVGPLGVALQVAGLCYANKHLTDGFVPHGAVRMLLDFNGLGEDIGEKVEHWCEVGAFNVAERLVEAGLWDEVEGGYRIHDYHDYQPTRDQVEADQAVVHKAKVAGGKARAAAARRDKGKFVSAGEAAGLGAGEKGFAKPQVTTSTTSSPPAEAPAADQQPTSTVPGPEPETKTTDGFSTTGDPVDPPKGGHTVVAENEFRRPVSVDRQVYDCWTAERHKRAGTKFSDGRRAAVQRALKAGYTTDDMFDAIRGMALDPWPDRPRHDDLTDALHIGSARKPRNNLEFFRDLWRNGGPPAVNGNHPAWYAHAQRRYAEALAEEAGQPS